jgi:hypothetical protein
MATDLDEALRQLTARRDVGFQPGRREAIEALALRRDRVMLASTLGRDS